MLNLLFPLFVSGAEPVALAAFLSSFTMRKQDENIFKITEDEAKIVRGLANTALLIDENIIKTGFDSHKISEIVSVEELKESAKYIIEIKKSCDTVLEKSPFLILRGKKEKAFLCNPYDAKEFIREFISGCIRLFIFTLDSYSRNNIQINTIIIRSNKYSRAIFENILEQIKNKIRKLELKEDQQEEGFHQVKEMICLLEEVVRLEDNKDEGQTQSESEEPKAKEDDSLSTEGNGQYVESDDKDNKDTIKDKVDGTIQPPVKFETLDEEYLRKVYKEFKGDLLAPEGQDHPTSEEAFLYYLGFNEDRPTEKAIYIHGDSATVICFVHHLIVEKDINIPKGKWQSLARVIMYPNKKNTEWCNPAYRSIRNGYTNKEDKPINLELRKRFNEIKK